MTTLHVRMEIATFIWVDIWFTWSYLYPLGSGGLFVQGICRPMFGSLTPARGQVVLFNLIQFASFTNLLSCRLFPDDLYFIRRSSRKSVRTSNMQIHQGLISKYGMTSKKKEFLKIWKEMYDAKLLTRTMIMALRMKNTTRLFDREMLLQSDHIYQLFDYPHSPPHHSPR